jgi:hypothetical protein
MFGSGGTCSVLAVPVGVTDSLEHKYVDNNTLNLSLKIDMNVSRMVEIITKHGSGRKSREGVPTKMLAIGYEGGVGVANSDSSSTNTLISTEHCSEQEADCKLCSKLNTGQAETITKLFEIF